MPRKFFPQRKTNRFLDTMVPSSGEVGSNSFIQRGSFNTAVPDAVWIDVHAAGRAPSNAAGGGKITTRSDSVLWTDLEIPTHSKILGGYVAVTLSANASAGHTINALDLAIFPDRSDSDFDLWRGVRNVNDYVWRRQGQGNALRATNIVTNGANFWFKLRESTTIRAQTSVAVAGVVTQGAVQFGRVRTDKATNVSNVSVEAFGNVVQVDSSGTIDNALIRVQRVGTYGASVNVVCKVYEYDAVNRAIGALRATSDAVDAAGITTSSTTETTFTFTSTFAITTNEYLLVTVEPQTTWNLSLSQYLQGLYMLAMDNSSSGTNAAGSEEIMWWKTQRFGNASAYLQANEIPALYSGASGVVKECVPYQGVISNTRFRSSPLTANQVCFLDLNPQMLRAIENYNRDRQAYVDRGLMWFLATGANGLGTLTWSNAATATTGVFLYYRSTRTFIT